MVVFVRRAQVVSDLAEVVPSFALRVVNNDECAKGGHWVGQEVVGLPEYAVVGRDGGLVGPCGASC